MIGVLPVATGDPELDPSVRAIAASGTDGLARLRDWADRQPAAAYRIRWLTWSSDRPSRTPARSTRSG